MTNKPVKSVVRIGKKHSSADAVAVTAEDGKHLVRNQSLRDATFAALIAIVAFSILWAMLSTLIDRIFPWMTVVLGIFVGLLVRRAGRGVDWRFPTLAAAMTLVGALVANVIVAAAFTAEALDTDTITVLRAVTSMTWPVFFDEAMSGADVVYALFGAGIAAFYANRRLTRREFAALRLWQQEQKAVRQD